jgi:hypothetical protein
MHNVMHNSNSLWREIIGDANFHESLNKISVVSNSNPASLGVRRYAVHTMIDARFQSRSISFVTEPLIQNKIA